MTEISKRSTDCIIIGAGIYGLYAALLLGRKGYHVILLEKEECAFQRGSYINQARLHMGYHYPRSISTARKSANYFERFYQDFPDCILDDFEQIYAISSKYSHTNARQFKKFCNALNIKCEEIDPEKYFRSNLCEAAFITKEYTFDATLICKKMLTDLSELRNVEMIYETEVTDINAVNRIYEVSTKNGKVYQGQMVVNAAYASVNQILNMIGQPFFELKYELCEVILCNVSENLKHTGITVMDGPFFSVMPFGKTGLHSLTSVTFTPHVVSHDALPLFSCQGKSEGCSQYALQNCSKCKRKPKSAWKYMTTLANKYINEDYVIDYKESLFTIKPILNKSEGDDSRPTVIVEDKRAPGFISVLSGKINTIYDLDEVLLE